MSDQSPEFAHLTAAERQRLARAERVDFDTLCRAVADIITERMGGVPVIPTAPFQWAEGADDVNTPVSQVGISSTPGEASGG